MFSGPAAVPPGLGEVDVVLPLLHGTFGEDGTIQGLLEMTGVKYAGAGVFASAAGMDKEYMKLLFAARGLPIGPYVVVRDRDWGPAASEAERKSVLDEIGELGWPVFVKPARAGRRSGRRGRPISTSSRRRSRRRGGTTARCWSRRRSTGSRSSAPCSRASTGARPRPACPGRSWWTRTHLVRLRGQVPGGEHPDGDPGADPGRLPEQVRALSCAAFDAISCEGPGRVDCFYTSDGDVLVNEINTMPGMTPMSGFPMMWAASGLPVPALIDRIIATALAKPDGRGSHGRSVTGAGPPAGRRARSAPWAATRRAAASEILPVPPPVDAALYCGVRTARGLTLALTSSWQRPWGPLRLARLVPVDQGLEVRPGAELRHRARGHVDLGTRRGVTRRPSRALALLEDAETGDRDLVAACHGRLDGLEDCVQRLGRGLLVPQATRERVDQITSSINHSAFLHGRPRCGHVRCIATPDQPKVGDLASLHNNLGQIGRRVGPTENRDQTNELISELIRCAPRL